MKYLCVTFPSKVYILDLLMLRCLDNVYGTQTWLCYTLQRIGISSRVGEGWGRDLTEGSKDERKKE